MRLKKIFTRKNTFSIRNESRIIYIRAKLIKLIEKMLISHNENL